MGMTRILVLLGAMLSLICPTTPAQQPRVLAINGAANAVTAAGHSAADQPGPSERNPRYRICREDVLSISFPLSSELNQKVTVQPDGFIALQIVGDIHVAGLTVAEAVEAVKKAYAGTLQEPLVDIDLTDFQKPFFSVLGHVGKPGQYDLRYDMTVTQAIAVAGGFAPTGKTQVFLYRPVSSTWAQVRQIKLKGILAGKNISEDVHLQPGDMIYVPEKAISKFKEYVPYSVGLSPTLPSGL
jgi:polysaccharide export outer membrane protein